MKTLAEQDLNDKQFALRVATMIDSGLINSLFYEPWTDEIISTMPIAPDWILDLTLVKDSAKAVELIREFVFSHTETIHPRLEENFAPLVNVEDYIACLYLKCGRREISWATFLEEAGDIADAESGRDSEVSCEYFYGLLNDLRMSLFSERPEIWQRTRIAYEFSDQIETIEPLYQGFVEYFRAKTAD